MTEYDEPRYIAPQQERSHRSLERIFEAAERVISRDGIAEFTIQRVTVEAGMSVGAIYRRFPSREALLHEVKRRALLNFQSTTRDAIDADADDPAAVTLNLIAHYGEKFSAHSAFYRFVFSIDNGLAAADSLGAELYRSAVDHFVERVQELPSGDGRIDATQLRFLFHLITATMIRRTTTFSSGLAWKRLTKELGIAARAYLASVISETHDE